MRTSDRTLLELETLPFRRAMRELAQDDPERAARLRAQRHRQRNDRHLDSLDKAGQERLRAMKRDWWKRVGSERRRQARG